MTLIPIVIRCGSALMPKVRYVFDTLLMAAGVPAVHVSLPPVDGPWLFYGERRPAQADGARCLALGHCPQAWALILGTRPIDRADSLGEVPLVAPQRSDACAEPDGIAFDLIANAFYFLASCDERLGRGGGETRMLHARCAQRRLGIPLDIVDRYMSHLLRAIDRLVGRDTMAPGWPGGARFAVVLSHDVDFVPERPFDNAKQGAKTLARHLVRERKPADAARAAIGLAKAWAAGRDPYGCIPQSSAGELAAGVRASYQVAVARRHPNDVNYDILNDRVRDYLRAICDAQFDLCLHGSYRSTEVPQWYEQEAALLAQRLAPPRGSRQHYLSFDYDALFGAQERAGIEYDMSMGFPDHCGPRAGFSYPYFPYCIELDRPYDVVELSLFLMDVTLRSYLRLAAKQAHRVVAATLQDLRRKGGCASVVWHPIVFGGARDPGFDALYWQLIDDVRSMGGWATDGRAVNEIWRRRAASYASFGFANRRPSEKERSRWPAS